MSDTPAHPLAGEPVGADNANARRERRAHRGDACGRFASDLSRVETHLAGEVAELTNGLAPALNHGWEIDVVDHLRPTAAYEDHDTARPVEEVL